MIKILIGFTAFLVASASSAVCTPDTAQPTGYRAEGVFAPEITNVQMTCAIAMDLVNGDKVGGSYLHRLIREFPKNPKDNRYAIEFKRNEEGTGPTWNPQTFREPRVTKPTKTGLENAIPTLSSWTMELPSSAVTTDSTDRRNLVKIFDHDSNENGSFFDQKITYPIFAQQVVSCDRSGKEIAKLQLISLGTQADFDKTGNPKGYRTSGRTEKPDWESSIVNTTAEANPTSQLVLKHKTRTNIFATISCRTTPLSQATDAAAPAKEEVQN